jgi:hypothetical protein
MYTAVSGLIEKMHANRPNSRTELLIYFSFIACKTTASRQFRQVEQGKV